VSGHLQPLSAPETVQLCSLADVRRQLGIPAGDGDGGGDGAGVDERIRSLLGAVAAAFSAVRAPWRLRWRVRLAGDGGHHLLLPLWPCEAVESVRHGGAELDPSTIEVVSTGGGHRSRDRLYRAEGWHHTGERRVRAGLDPPHAGTRPLRYEVVGVFGWLLPPQLASWSAGSSFGGPDEPRWTRPTDRTHLLRFEATTAGVEGDAEPDWPTAAGETVADGSIVWTARAAAELPDDLRIAAVHQAAEWYGGGLELPGGVRSERDGDSAITYEPGALAPHLNRAVRSILQSHGLA